MEPTVNKGTRSGREVAVVGAGIGGLGAAIALARAGWEPTVFEAEERLRPLGAGLSVWPNGTRALRQLGLGDLVESAPRTGGALRRADGSPLAEFDPEGIAARYGAPLIGVHRGDLQAALLAALGSERVRTGMRLERLEGDRLRFAGGEEVSADLVVGADGIGSSVRKAILADGDPRDPGLVAFRGVAPVERSVPVGEWWAAGSVAGLLELGGGRVYWYVAYRGEPDREALPRLLAGYGEELRAVAAATDPDDVLLHRLLDRDPVASWSQGSATLLGDAAHPMLPFLGQGANAALADAVALGAALAEEADVAAALRRYERERVKATAALVSGSRRAAKAALTGSAIGRRLRDAALSRLPESARLRQLDPYLGRV